jgi:hypothetical protein
VPSVLPISPSQKSDMVYTGCFLLVVPINVQFMSYGFDNYWDSLQNEYFLVKYCPLLRF